MAENITTPKEKIAASAATPRSAARQRLPAAATSLLGGLGLLALLRRRR